MGIKISNFGRKKLEEKKLEEKNSKKNSKKKLEEKTRRKKLDEKLEEKLEEKMMPTEEFMVSEVFQYEENNEIQYEVQFVTEDTNTEYYEIPAEDQLILDDEEIILEPVKTPVKTGGSKSTRSTGTLSRKRSYKPVDELIRPGKKAKVPDSQLTEKQLLSRNKRRARNREAAQRQRDRRLQKSALFEEKIEKLELENKNWEEKYRILEEKFQKVEFQLKMAQRKKFTGPIKKTNQKLEKLDQSEAFLTAYQPAKLVHIEKPKPKHLKLSIPAQSTMTSSTTTVCPPTRAATDNLNESFCNLNDFIKVDTPTAKHVEKMALTGQDSFFTLFDL